MNGKIFVGPLEEPDPSTSKLCGSARSGGQPGAISAPGRPKTMSSSVFALGFYFTPLRSSVRSTARIGVPDVAGLLYVNAGTPIVERARSNAERRS
jgi:hypothetical protein